ncbi:metallophosphoesterase [Vibrio mimicus]
MMNILHLTDLHIANPTGCDEALRVGYYKEYIYDLKSSIGEQQIDMIVVTGDIVDRSKFDNYQHAEEVLRYLATSLSVSLDRVFICNGNHDVCRKTGSRQKFDEFSESLSGGKNKVFSSDYYTGYKLENDLILVIDSININYATGLPCAEVVEKIVDGIVLDVQQQNVENVFILAHHATDGGEMAVFATLDEGVEWSKDHMWYSGDLIFRRIAREPNISGKAFWFAGDVHMPQHLVIDDKRVISLTGSMNFVGGDVHGTTMSPSVRLINSENIYTSSQFEYRRVSHGGTGCEGRWVEVSIDAVSRQSSKPRSGVPEHNPVVISAKLNNIVDDLAKSVPEKESDKLMIWNSDFDTALKDEIKRKELYKFGQFSKSGQFTSLAWISITQLFQSPSIYGETVKNFTDAVKHILKETGCDKQDCLIVGIDNWGAILSARLGAATNIRSCGIGVNGGNDSYDDAEIVNNELKHIIQNKKLVFLVSDVVATGSTVSKVFTELTLECNDKVANLSVFIDALSDYVELPEFDFNVVLCGSVKIPVIETNKLV